MLSEGEKPIKQGWVLKKAGSGFLAQWKPKYLVLLPYHENDMQLLVFDQRDVFKPPKHKIILSECKTEIGDNSKFHLLGNSSIPFTIYANARKFYFACNTKFDLDDWMKAFKSCKPNSGYASSRSRLPSFRDEWDAKSVYSIATEYQDDDCRSVLSGITKASRIDEESHLSNVDTLSFYSETVLTPQELTVMGEKSNEKEKRRAPNTRGLNKYRKKDLMLEAWNEKYQELMTKKAITEEAEFQKDISLVELIGDFQELATYHAKNMIDEYHINHQMQNSYQIGNDLSCSRDGINFRFACDYEATSLQNVEATHSRTSAELRAINAVAKAAAKVPEPSKMIHTVLMALVDYKGFRVVCHAEISQKPAMAVLHDLNPKKLKIDERACELTSSIGQCYNLQSHTVQINQDRRVRVYLAATTELILDQNTNRVYASSLKDMFPLDHYINSDIPDIKLVNPGTICLERRLRPEFLIAYQSLICSDGLTPASGASISEKEENDLQVLKASRFLRESWIPSFILSLDSLEVRPFDSESLTFEMHQKGINMRYLGLICGKSNIPFIRTICAIEMIARCCKQLFRSRLREAILHFKSVGATNIEKEMKQYAASFFSIILGNGDKSKQIFESKLRPLMAKKYNYDISMRQYLSLNRNSLFLALQYHTGVCFEDTTDYDFQTQNPIHLDRFICFKHKTKTCNGLPKEVVNSQLKEDDRLAYHLHRHFKSLGVKGKLNPSNESAIALTKVASHFNNSNRFEEARLYSQAAFNMAASNHIVSALASAQLIQALAGLQSTTMGGPDPTILVTYRQALTASQWHWGQDNLVMLCLHDIMSKIFHKAKDYKQALEFHMQSLSLAEKCLGKSHFITAGYLARAGCYFYMLGDIERSITNLSEAAEIFKSLQASPSVLAEVHFYIAESLSARGDVDGAIQHSQKCRKIREKIFGLSDIRVMESCRQTAKMILAPYQEYKGVLTSQMKQAFREAIQCHEKVFRYLQSKNNRNRLSKRGTLSRKPSMKHNSEQVKEKDLISGPLVKSPYGWTPGLTPSILHKLTKDIVKMKLELADSPRYREVIRMLRTSKREQDPSMAFDASEARAAIIRMASVSPSVYLDDIFYRIDHDDDTAIHELGLVMTLTESETLGIAQ